MVRPPACCGNANLRRGLWTPEEDAKILAYVSKHGIGNWTSVPKKAGLRRCGKSCRLRWNNYLRPDLNHESFTQQEEEMIVRLHAAIGSRWSIIAQQLPGRTDNDVKNHWNTKLRKKLSEMGIDPVTHKPFSQILADYGNINGGLSRPSAASSAAARSSIGSLSRDLKNVAHLFVNNNNPDQHQQHNYSSVPPQSSAGVSSITAAAHFMEQPEEILPITECFVGNRGEGGGEEESMDLMDQLQAIKLVTEAAAAAAAAGEETNYYNDDEGMAAVGGSPFPSSSSSSSTCSTAAAAAAEMKKSATTTTTSATPPLSFSWRDFLLEDDDAGGGGAQFPQENDDDLNGNIGEFSSPREQQSLAAAAGEGGLLSRGVIGSSSSGSSAGGGGGYVNASSFVEAILDGDERRDMFLDFPNLLQDPTYYH